MIGERIIAAPWVLPMAQDLPWCIEEGGVWMRDGRIAAVGPMAALEQALRAAGRDPDRIARDYRRESVLLPGLVNAHTHLFQSYLRGVADDAGLESWLRRVIWPWTEHFTESDYYESTLLGALENLRGGVTTLAEHAYMTAAGSVDGVVEALARSGLRAQIAYAYADQHYPGTLRETPERVFERLDDLRMACQRHADRLRPALGPNTLWGVSRPLLRDSGNYARSHGLPLHIHVAETRREQSYTLEHYGMRNVELLAALDLLGPELQMVHGVWLEEDELAQAAGAGAALMHCPTSNMYLASGTASVPRALSLGLRVGLASDGPASNNSQDMFESMKFAACLHKLDALDPTVLGIRQVLSMATIEGARILGLDREIGSLEPGKAADLIRVDLSGLHCAPVHDPASALVYNAHAGDVRDVWVAGEPMLQDGQFMHHDVGSSLATARAGIARIRALARPWDAQRLRLEGLEE